MPITKSAKKRVRQEKLRKSRNKLVSLKVKKDIKNFLESLSKKDKKKSNDLLKICQKQLAKAVKQGLLKKTKVSRKISSLNKKIKAI
ncbi:MAG: 30S ribosomal protein S20 [Alphaproteobacteria bacterium MarineAlpha6_Bin4]|nr:MAG: 30S ribosomal protein S20 [Alphaproteobacteria bacterium MarineAlpha6_Bin5]PPR37707.1 MAG: 30S ribosomal protein S20 [Alphaproteobacteria bacterium MarineAlpha6_Bin4]|tara:strand:- start:14231 stop:14491 length:261 start_codon:yes stop_codon:yes gene_type:complete